MTYVDDMENYISIKGCKRGGLYRILARNFSLGLYDSKQKGFIGIRQKFKMEFLDVEYHWDIGNPYGTAKPVEFLEQCNLHIDIKNGDILNWVKEKEKYYL